ncbi:MAG TPA: hypothetical protein PKC45_19605 [Gemmatales bacterium]|nr:hypothetical protein [Gemmatales bacterium]
MEPHGDIIERWRWEFYRLPDVGFRLLQEESNTLVPAVRVRGANTQYRFEAMKRSASDAWVVTTLEKQDAQDQASFRMRDAARQVENGFMAPFALSHLLLNEVIGAAGFKVLGEESVSTSQGLQMAVDFEFRPERPIHELKAMNGRIVVDPSIYWAIASADVEVEYKGMQRVRLMSERHYKRRGEDIPLIHSALARSIHVGPEPSETYCVQSSFDWKTDPPPPSTFYLSDLGLPEPFGVDAPNRPTPWWLYALISAGVLFVVAVIVSFWKRRLAARQSA